MPLATGAFYSNSSLLPQEIGKYVSKEQDKAFSIIQNMLENLDLSSNNNQFMIALGRHVISYCETLEGGDDKWKSITQLAISLWKIMENPFLPPIDVDRIVGILNELLSILYRSYCPSAWCQLDMKHEDLMTAQDIIHFRSQLNFAFLWNLLIESFTISPLSQPKTTASIRKNRLTSLIKLANTIRRFYNFDVPSSPLSIPSPSISPEGEVTFSDLCPISEFLKKELIKHINVSHDKTLLIAGLIRIFISHKGAYQWIRSGFLKELWLLNLGEIDSICLCIIHRGCKYSIKNNVSVWPYIEKDFSYICATIYKTLLLPINNSGTYVPKFDNIICKDYEVIYDGKFSQHRGPRMLALLFSSPPLSSTTLSSPVLSSPVSPLVEKYSRELQKISCLQDAKVNETFRSIFESLAKETPLPQSSQAARVYQFLELLAITSLSFSYPSLKGSYTIQLCSFWTRFLLSYEKRLRYERGLSIPSTTLSRSPTPSSSLPPPPSRLSPRDDKILIKLTLPIAINGMMQTQQSVSQAWMHAIHRVVSWAPKFSLGPLCYYLMLLMDEESESNQMAVIWKCLGLLADQIAFALPQFIPFSLSHLLSTIDLGNLTRTEQLFTLIAQFLHRFPLPIGGFSQVSDISTWLSKDPSLSSTILSTLRNVYSACRTLQIPLSHHYVLHHTPLVPLSPPEQEDEVFSFLDDSLYPFPLKRRTNLFMDKEHADDESMKALFHVLFPPQDLCQVQNPPFLLYAERRYEAALQLEDIASQCFEHILQVCETITNPVRTSNTAKVSASYETDANLLQTIQQLLHALLRDLTEERAMAYLRQFQTWHGSRSAYQGTKAVGVILRSFVLFFPLSCREKMLRDVLGVLLRDDTTSDRTLKGRYGTEKGVGWQLYMLCHVLRRCDVDVLERHYGEVMRVVVLAMGSEYTSVFKYGCKALRRVLVSCIGLYPVLSSVSLNREGQGSEREKRERDRALALVAYNGNPWMKEFWRSDYGETKSVEKGGEEVSVERECPVVWRVAKEKGMAMMRRILNFSQKMVLGMLRDDLREAESPLLKQEREIQWDDDRRGYEKKGERYRLLHEMEKREGEYLLSREGRAVLCSVAALEQGVPVGEDHEKINEGLYGDWEKEMKSKREKLSKAQQIARGLKLARSTIKALANFAPDERNPELIPKEMRDEIKETEKRESGGKIECERRQAECERENGEEGDKEETGALSKFVNTKVILRIHNFDNTLGEHLLSWFGSLALLVFSSITGAQIGLLKQQERVSFLFSTKVSSLSSPLPTPLGEKSPLPPTPGEQSPFPNTSLEGSSTLQKYSEKNKFLVKLIPVIFTLLHRSLSEKNEPETPTKWAFLYEYPTSKLHWASTPSLGWYYRAETVLANRIRDRFNGIPVYGIRRYLFGTLLYLSLSEAAHVRDRTHVAMRLAVANHTGIKSPLLYYMVDMASRVCCRLIDESFVSTATENLSLSSGQSSKDSPPPMITLTSHPIKNKSLHRKKEQENLEEGEGREVEEAEVGEEEKNVEEEGGEKEEEVEKGKGRKEEQTKEEEKKEREEILEEERSSPVENISQMLDQLLMIRSRRDDLSLPSEGNLGASEPRTPFIDETQRAVDQILSITKVFSNSSTMRRVWTESPLLSKFIRLLFLLLSTPMERKEVSLRIFTLFDLFLKNRCNCFYSSVMDDGMIAIEASSKIRRMIAESDRFSSHQTQRKLRLWDNILHTVAEFQKIAPSSPSKHGSPHRDVYLDEMDDTEDNDQRQEEGDAEAMWQERMAQTRQEEKERGEENKEERVARGRVAKEEAESPWSDILKADILPMFDFIMKEETVPYFLDKTLEREKRKKEFLAQYITPKSIFYMSSLIACSLSSLPCPHLDLQGEQTVSTFCQWILHVIRNYYTLPAIQSLNMNLMVSLMQGVLSSCRLRTAYWCPALFGTEEKECGKGSCSPVVESPFFSPLLSPISPNSPITPISPLSLCLEGLKASLDADRCKYFTCHYVHSPSEDLSYLKNFLLVWKRSSAMLRPLLETFAFDGSSYTALVTCLMHSGRNGTSRGREGGRRGAREKDQILETAIHLTKSDTTWNNFDDPFFSPDIDIKNSYVLLSLLSSLVSFQIDRLSAIFGVDGYLHKCFSHLLSLPNNDPDAVSVLLEVSIALLRFDAQIESQVVSALYFSYLSGAAEERGEEGRERDAGEDRREDRRDRGRGERDRATFDYFRVKGAQLATKTRLQFWKWFSPLLGNILFSYPLSITQTVTELVRHVLYSENPQDSHQISTLALLRKAKLHPLGEHPDERKGGELMREDGEGLEGQGEERGGGMSGAFVEQAQHNFSKQYTTNLMQKLPVLHYLLSWCNDSPEGMLRNQLQHLREIEREMNLPVSEETGEEQSFSPLSIYTYASQVELSEAKKFSWPLNHLEEKSYLLQIKDKPKERGERDAEDIYLSLLLSSISTFSSPVYSIDSGSASSFAQARRACVIEGMALDIGLLYPFLLPRLIEPCLNAIFSCAQTVNMQITNFFWKLLIVSSSPLCPAGFVDVVSSELFPFLRKELESISADKESLVFDFRARTQEESSPEIVGEEGKGEEKRREKDEEWKKKLRIKTMRTLSIISLANCFASNETLTALSTDFLDIYVFSAVSTEPELNALANELLYLPLYASAASRLPLSLFSSPESPVCANTVRPSTQRLLERVHSLLLDSAAYPWRVRNKLLSLLQCILCSSRPELHHSPYLSLSLSLLSAFLFDSSPEVSKNAKSILSTLLPNLPHSTLLLYANQMRDVFLQPLASSGGPVLGIMGAINAFPFSFPRVLSSFVDNIFDVYGKASKNHLIKKELQNDILHFIASHRDIKLSKIKKHLIFTQNQLDFIDSIKGTPTYFS